MHVYRDLIGITLHPAVVYNINYRTYQCMCKFPLLHTVQKAEIFSIYKYAHEEIKCC